MSERNTNVGEDRLRELFEAYLSGQLRAEDRQELAEGLATPAGEALIQEVMERPVGEKPPVESLPVKTAIDQWLAIRAKPPVPVRSLRKWSYAIAAAVVIVLAGAFGYIWLKPREPQKDLTQRYKNDLRPGRDKAILKLSDGRLVELDEKTTGNIAGQNDADIRTDSGWLRYIASKEPHENDLSTPAGAQIRLLLADGTRVWLDASSSIHYPTAFPSGNREVTITGQAYFEVAPNAHQAFIVHAKGQTIRVLGTHFNVNAYQAGGAAVKTTLEQGSILVHAGNGDLRLAPGQQADGTVLRSDVDLESILAWKNGEFRFNGASIRDIMDQLARWYGAEVHYKDEISEEFVAKIPRNVPVSKILNYLESTGQVKFMVEGNIITVMK